MLIIRNALFSFAYPLTMSRNDFANCYMLHNIKVWNNMIAINTRLILLVKLYLHSLVLGCHLLFTPDPSPPSWEVVASGTYSSLKLHILGEGCNFTPC